MFCLMLILRFYVVPSPPFRVQAYALRNDTMGFCQSLTYIVEVLMLVSNVEEARTLAWKTFGVFLGFDKG